MQKENNEELIVLSEVTYPVSMNEIQEFNAKWDDVPELIPENGTKDTDYIAVRAAHIEAVKFRTSIEKQRKHLKEPSIAYGKAVDSVAKELQGTINPKELQLFSERKKVEQYEADLEAKRIADELYRQRDIDNKIQHLRNIPSNMIGALLDDLLEVYESIAIPEADVFEERLDEAINAYKDTLVKLEVMIDQSKAAVEAAAIKKEQEDRLKKEQAEREALEAKKAEELRAEREAFEKEKAEFIAMKEAKEEAERIAAIEEEAEEAEPENITLTELSDIIKEYAPEGKTYESLAKHILEQITAGNILGVSYEQQ